MLDQKNHHRRPLHEQLQSREERIAVAPELLAKIESMVAIEGLTDEQKIAVLQLQASDYEDIIDADADIELPFGIVRDVWDDMARITHAPDWDNLRFSWEQMAAQKLYAAGLFEMLAQHETTGGLNPHQISKIERAYFSSSDLLTNYTGGFASELELYALSRRSKAGREISASLLAGLAYTGTFSDIRPGLHKAWESQKDIGARLNYLSSLEVLRMEALDVGYGDFEMLDAIQDTLADIIEDDKTTALASVYAATIFGQAEEDRHLEVADPVWMTAPEPRQLSFAERNKKELAMWEQDALHNAYPQFPSDAFLRKIASDACVAIEQGSFGRLVTIDGKEANVHRPNQKNNLGYTEDDNKLLGAVHEPRLLSAIEKASGLCLADISLNTQLRFMRFMAESSMERYERICLATKSLESADQENFLDAFLATEFGDDYGDAILDIAEHTERHQAMHIFETVNTLRVRTGEFAEMFKAIDPKFAHATEKAFNERITDALTALQEVAVKGHLHQDVAPHQKKADYVHDGRFDIAVHSIEEATEIIDGLEKTFGTMHKITTAEDLKITKVNSDETQFVMYRLAGQSAGNMLIYIRPEGAYGHDKQMEYGNRQGVEASISFMVDPLNPRKLLLPKDPDAVSIRFDHEGRLVDEAPNSERRDPTRRDGLISADLSSGMGRASSLAVKIGRFVAAGNRIRANRKGTEDSLHHNTNYFDQEKYGDADGFAHLARSVIRQIELMKKILRSKKIGMAAHVTTKTTGSEQVDLPKAA